MGLLEGKQAEGVVHERRHRVLAIPPAHRALQAAYGQGIGREAKVGFGLPAAGGEPQQIGDGRRVRPAIGVRQIGDPRQIDQNEGQLKRTTTSGCSSDGRHAGIGPGARETGARRAPPALASRSSWERRSRR